MKNKLVKTLGASFAVTTMGAHAGEPAPVLAAPPAENSGDWCDALQGLGTLYKSSDNPWIQEVKLFGRFHYHYGYSDISNNGNDYSGQGDEIRRFRTGLSVKFLNGFKALGRFNIQEGGFRNHEAFSYGGMDELYLEYDFGDTGFFEDLSVGYGRYKLLFGGEEYTSSKKIKTIERSNLNNLFAPVPNRPTGLLVKASRGDYDMSFGFFSAASGDQDWSDWAGGEFYFGSIRRNLGDDSALRADLVINDASEVEDEILGYDWATSLTYDTQLGAWDVMANFTYGDMGSEDVYGIVIMPSYMLIEDRLEAVFRYQWANSSGDIIPATKRNVRKVAGNEDPARGIASGDENHTFYAGLNYFLCDHNAKVMVGAEYETLDGDRVDLEATTLWAAFRMYF